jgi:hypothetical protein
VKIEPAPRHELETQLAINQPCGESASHHHRDRMHNGYSDGRAEIGVDEGACRLMASVKVGDPAEPEINQHEHPAPCAIATAKEQSPS